jgi:hypothetical protein
VGKPPRLGLPTIGAPLPTANARRPAIAAGATTQRLGGIAAQGFTGGLLKTDQMDHYQPAKDQKVTIAEPGPQRLKKSLYFFGQTRYLNYGWPLGKSMNKAWLASFYSQAGQPASLWKN